LKENFVGSDLEKVVAKMVEISYGFKTMKKRKK
jgi:hypothetical protein